MHAQQNYIRTTSSSKSFEFLSQSKLAFIFIAQFKNKTDTFTSVPTTVLRCNALWEFRSKLMPNSLLGNEIWGETGRLCSFDFFMVGQ